MAEARSEGKAAGAVGGRAAGARSAQGRGKARRSAGAEAAVRQARALLGAALRRRRTQRALTQVRLATLLGSSQSRVAKMEAADATVSLDLLVKGLVVLGLSRPDVGRILAAER